VYGFTLILAESDKLSLKHQYNDISMMEAAAKVNSLYKSYILRGLLVKALHCELEGHGSNPTVGYLL